MRKVTYGAAVSLDGYIAGPDDSLDWLQWSNDVEALLEEGWKGVDAALLGRKTFYAGGGLSEPGVRKYLFSRTAQQAPSGAELVKEDAAGFVRKLKQEPGGNIVLMGGGELASALIRGGVVDEIRLDVHPVLLGGGTPLFRRIEPRVELRLLESRRIAHGCVYLRYAVIT